MNSIATSARLSEDASGAATRLANVVLARLVAGAASDGVVARDLAGLVAGPPALDTWQAQIARIVAALASTGYIVRDGDTLALTPSGMEQAARFLGARNSKVDSWAALRDGPLLLAALGMANATAARQKAATKIDGLRALIVEAHWTLKLKGKPSASRIRHALALAALERAFGNQVKTELGAKSALSAKASRLLAGQLAKKPRDFGTDSRLVAALAAEAVGVKRSDLAQLRTGVLRRFLADVALATPAMTGRSATPPPSIAQSQPAPSMAPSHPDVARGRPDPAGFASAVKAAAGACAEGWSGNRRAFVSHVWALIRERHAGWGLSEIEFKAMLAEAHRGGLIMLTNADLRDKSRIKDVQDSAVPYKNTVWHYVRADA